MTTLITRLLELGVHALEEEEQDALFEHVRAELSLMRRQPEKPGSKTTIQLKKEATLMAVTQTTDDQVIIQVFSMADADMVPVDGSGSPVAVTVVDNTGADVSKWIGVSQDSTNPLKFVYSRKPDTDGTQPQDLAFTSIGTATVNGTPTELRSDFEFTPGAATSLTSTITTGAATPASGGSGSGSGPAEQPPASQEQAG